MSEIFATILFIVFMVIYHYALYTWFHRVIGKNSSVIQNSELQNDLYLK